MKKRVKHISSIQTGLFAKPSGAGDVVYLQARHFDEQGQLLATLHPDLLAQDVSEKHLLKPGDVLFAAKGAKNFAAVYTALHKPAVASTSFFVIRISSRQILPEYLAWFLNSPATQTLLKAQAKGTSILSISKQVLESLELSAPSLEKQEAIVQITRLRNQEKALKQQMGSLRDIQIQHLIDQAIR